jgi:hypothetical protein
VKSSINLLRDISMSYFSRAVSYLSAGAPSLDVVAGDVRSAASAMSGYAQQGAGEFSQNMRAGTWGGMAMGAARAVAGGVGYATARGADLAAVGVGSAVSAMSRYASQGANQFSENMWGKDKEGTWAGAAGGAAQALLAGGGLALAGSIAAAAAATAATSTAAGVALSGVGVVAGIHTLRNADTWGKSALGVLQIATGGASGVAMSGHALATAASAASAAGTAVQAFAALGRGGEGAGLAAHSRGVQGVASTVRAGTAATLGLGMAARASGVVAGVAGGANFVAKSGSYYDSAKTEIARHWQGAPPISHV